MRASMTRHAGALAIAVLAASCGDGGATHVTIGLKRVGVDLAFRDDEQPGAPVSVGEIIAPLAVAAPFNLAPARRSLRPPLRISSPCPPAPPGANPDRTAPAFITEPPKAGVYPALLKAKGQLIVGPLTFPLSGTIPTTVEYANVSKHEVPAVVFAGTETAPAKVEWTYDHIVRLGTIESTSSFRLRPDESTPDILLERRVETTEQTTTTFDPTELTWYQMLGEGRGAGGTDQWNSAGVDPASKWTATVQGSNTTREPVDVCGTMHDTYRVDQKERIVSADPANPFEYRTKEDQGTPNVYNMATQLGGLVLRTEYHYTQTGTADYEGAKVAVTLDVDATLSLLRTEPLAESDGA